MIGALVADFDPKEKVFSVEYTGEDIKELAEEFGIDLDEAMSRARNWGDQIQDYLSGTAQTMLRSAVEHDDV